MGYTHGTAIDDEFRVCTICKRKLPNTHEYFKYSNKRTGSLDARCKDCASKITREKNKKIRENNKNLDLKTHNKDTKCKKCGRVLPWTMYYFPVDLACNGGLRSICRECNPKYRNFLSEDYIANEKWSEKDLELLKSVYHDYTNEELVEKFFQNRTKHALDTQADKYGFAWKTEETYNRSRKMQGEKISKIFKGRHLSDSTKKKLSDSMNEYYKTHTPWWKGKKRPKSQCKQISERNTAIGKWKGENNPRYKKPLHGESNPNWQGGLTSFYQELRSDTKQWFLDSAEFCDYSCVISGLNFDNVHHTISFKDIVDDTLYICDLDKRSNVSDYSNEEFDNLTDVLQILHEEYGYGACINSYVHTLFHKNYGYKNFSPYDFLDFVYRIDCGDFNDWFTENNIPININYEYIEYLESTLSKIGLSA